MTQNNQIPFTKMNGTGNDFVIIDAREGSLSGLTLTDAQVQKLANRNNPITKGCDQVLIIRPPQANGAVFMEIRNADGSEATACGNGARCVAAYLSNYEMGNGSIETKGNILHCHVHTMSMASTSEITDPETGAWTGPSPPQANTVLVGMGQPKFDWQSIPLNEAIEDTAEVKLHDDLPPAFLVNVGNPHAVFFIDRHPYDYAEKYGRELETHAIFKDRANINFASIIDKPTGQRQLPQTGIALQVWERGAGLTQACGTGACATVVAACKKNLVTENMLAENFPKPENMIAVFFTDKHSMILAEVSLRVEYKKNNEITLNGEAYKEFDNMVTL